MIWIGCPCCQKTAYSFPLSISLGTDGFGFLIPDWGWGGNAGGYQEGSRTQVSFLVRASAAFAAVFTAFQRPAEGTVFRLSTPAEQTQTPDTLARPPFLFMGERVCCGTWWVGTVSRVYKGTGRREARENDRYCEPKSRTTIEAL